MTTCRRTCIKHIGARKKRSSLSGATVSLTRPWLLSINPFDPHPPFDAPWEYYRRYDPGSLPGAHFLDSDLKHQQGLQEAGIDFQNVARHPDKLQHKHLQASYYAMIEFLDR